MIGSYLQTHVIVAPGFSRPCSLEDDRTMVTVVAHCHRLETDDYFEAAGEIRRMYGRHNVCFHDYEDNVAYFTLVDDFEEVCDEYRQQAADLGREISRFYMTSVHALTH